MAAEDQGSLNNPMFKVFTNLLKIINNDTKFKKALLEMKERYNENNEVPTNLLTDDDLSKDNLIEIKLYCKAYIYTFLDNKYTRDDSIDIDKEIRKKIVDKNIELDDTEVEPYLRSYRRRNRQPPSFITNQEVESSQETNREYFDYIQKTFVINSIHELLKKILEIIDNIDSLLNSPSQTSPTTQRNLRDYSLEERQALKDITNTYMEHQEITTDGQHQETTTNGRNVRQRRGGGSKKRTKRKRNNKKSKKRKRKTLRRRQRS